MPAKTRFALAAALVLACASSALADSIDGNPLDRTDRQPRASLRGSPAILFEGHGGPLDACATDDGYDSTRLCGVGAGF